MGEHFMCSICGQQHEGVVTNQAYTLPDDVWNLPETERAQKARFDNDLCQFGERYFIRGLLLVPFLSKPDAFGWGVWVEVEWPTFKRYLDLYEADGSSEPAHRGLLANDILAYPSSIGSDVYIHFRGASDRPLISAIPLDGSHLAREQQHGMNDVRYHQILDLIDARNSVSR